MGCHARQSLLERLVFAGDYQPVTLSHTSLMTSAWSCTPVSTLNLSCVCLALLHAAAKHAKGCASAGIDGYCNLYLH